MKTHGLFFLAAMLVLPALPATSTHADDAHHQGGDAGDRKQGMMMHGGGMGMMDMDRMQEHMKEMRQEMERIHRTDDPEERGRLMREHMEMMHEGMGGMRGMMGMGMGKSAEEHRQMMERRMDMMQEMMEQMMEHMMAQQEAKGPAAGERIEGDKRHDH